MVIIFEHWNNWLIFWKPTHTNIGLLFCLMKTFPMENSNLEIKRPTQLRIKYCHISIQYLQAHELRFGWNMIWFNMNLFVDIKQIIKKINCTRTAKMTIERTEAIQSLSICEFIPKLLSESSITYKIEFTLRSVFLCYVQWSLENENRFWIRFENGKSNSRRYSEFHGKFPKDIYKNMRLRVVITGLLKRTEKVWEGLKNDLRYQFSPHFWT